MADGPTDPNPRETEAALLFFDAIYDRAEDDDLDQVDLIYAIWSGLVCDLLDSGFTAAQLQDTVSYYASSYSRRNMN